jgi:ferredoxin
VQAIASDYELGPEHRHYIPLNAELAQSWPVAFSGPPAHPDAHFWSEQTNKLALLQR